MSTKKECEGCKLRFDLYQDGKLVKKDDEVRLMGTATGFMFNNALIEGFDLALQLRIHTRIPSYYTHFQFIVLESRPATTLTWYGAQKLTRWLLDCEQVKKFQQGFLAINFIERSNTAPDTVCDDAFTLKVDLFSNGKVFKRGVRIPVLYNHYSPGGGMMSDLIEAVRLYMQPNGGGSKKMMGRVYVADRAPADLAKIPWNQQGTFVSGEPGYLVSCYKIHEYEKKYVAIDTSMITCDSDDETLKIDIYWRGSLLKKGYEVPLRYSHGERQFGESRVDIAEAIRKSGVIPDDTQDTTIQYVTKSARPTYNYTAQDWAARKSGKSHLMAKCDEVKMLQQRFMAVNIMPVVTIEGLKCQHCTVFDAVLKHNETKQFYCSKQCFLDSLTL